MVFHTTLIFISQSSTVLRKNCLCQHFLQNIIPVNKKRTWFVTQILIITKKSSTYTKGDYSGLSSDINIYISGFHRFEKKLLMSVFFTIYRPVSKKRTWFVTQILIITKKSSTYTKWDYSGLSYDINIYISGFRRFEKKLLMSVFFTIYRPVSKKRTWFVTQILIITEKSSTYNQGDYSGHSYYINIYNPEFHRFEKKLLQSVFFTRYRPVSKKSTWFVTQIQIITKESSTYTQGDYSGLL